MGTDSSGNEVTHRLRLSEDADRIDRALAEALPFSRTRIQGLIAAGRVEVDGHPVDRPSEAVIAGVEIVVRVPPKREPTLEPIALPLSVLYEDKECLVVDKPPGLVVHPAPGHPTDTLVNALLYHRPRVAGVGGEKKAGLVHRLDKDTSGCLLVAKNDDAHVMLAAQFAARTVDKTYWAFTWGHLADGEGAIEAPIGRSLRDRQKMSTRSRKGRPAVTRYRVRERYEIGEWLEIELVTGRTHQIRVHMAETGHPVIGDGRYGGGRSRARGYQGPRRAWADRVGALAGRQSLHARSIAFDRPRDGERKTVVSPLPEDLERLRETLREQGRS